MSRNTNAPLPDAPGVERTSREVNGVSLHVVAAGDPDDPLVVLLHGFPEFWYEWHDYVAPLVEAGYRVLVPDQRGYNRSGKPGGVRSYRITELSRDVVDLIATEDRERAHVIGHDWGAAVAWDVALRHPGAVDRLGIINVPHPTVFEATLRSNPRQLAKSWYALFFQLTGVADWTLRRGDYAFLVRGMTDGARPGTFTDADLQRYRRAWAEPGALRSMLHWYRARLRHPDAPPRETVEAPTLVLWGENDQALVPEMAPRSVDYCEDGRLGRFPDASHWLPHEETDRVVASLLDHLDA